MIFNNKSPIVVRRRKGTADDPFVDIEEFLTVTLDGKVTLTEIPERYNRVLVKDGESNLYEIETGGLGELNYIVDYTNKLVTLHPSQIGKQLKFIYKGTGLEYIPTSMIYTKLEDGEVVETLESIVTNSQEAIESIDKSVLEIEGLKTEVKSLITESSTSSAYAKEQGQFANEKATLADQKATLANEKATLAQSAIDNANIKINELTEHNTQAETLITKLSTAVDNADAKILETETARQETITATSNANDATSQTKIAIANAEAATTNANLSITSMNNKLTEADNKINELDVVKQNAEQTINNVNSSISELSHKDEYSPIVTYKPNNIVSFNGSSYMNIVTCIGVEPTDTTKWKLIAEKGEQGIQGNVGAEGKSAYQIWLDNGNEGTESDYIASLKGETGETGIQGNKGDTGKSAYQIAIDNGFVGTEKEWLASLKGEKGDAGDGNVLSVNNKTGTVVLNAQDVGAIPSSQLGVADGVAKLNSDGKVVDSNGNLVEGKVTSVNGMIGDVVLETSPTKLAKYNYLLTANTDNQTVFEIPLKTFDNTTDFLQVVQNSNVLDDASYTILGTTMTLKTGVVLGTELYISIIKYIFADSGKAVSGALIEDGTIALSKLSEAVAKASDLASKSNIDHTHEITDINGLATKLETFVEESQIGVPNGIASLNQDGKVPSTQLDVDLSNLATKNEVTTHLNDYMAHDSSLNYSASGVDNNGIYTILDFKRADNTLYLKSTLSNQDQNGNYLTCTWQFYNNAGDTVALTKTWTLTYDNKKKITSATVA